MGLQRLHWGGGFLANDVVLGLRNVDLSYEFFELIESESFIEFNGDFSLNRRTGWAFRRRAGMFSLDYVVDSGLQHIAFAILRYLVQ